MYQPSIWVLCNELYKLSKPTAKFKYDPAEQTIFRLIFFIVIFSTDHSRYVLCYLFGHLFFSTESRANLAHRMVSPYS